MLRQRRRHRIPISHYPGFDFEIHALMVNRHSPPTRIASRGFQREAEVLASLTLEPTRERSPWSGKTVHLSGNTV
jgi:hypothetical protein